MEVTKRGKVDILSHNLSLGVMSCPYSIVIIAGEVFKLQIRRDYAKNLTKVVFPGVRPLLSPWRALATWKLVILRTESDVCRMRVF